MKKWYKKTVTKAAVLLTAIFSGALLMSNLITAMSIAGTGNPVEVWKMTGESYVESPDFSMTVENSMIEVMEKIRLENLFETDGAYNSDRVVDIMEYSKQGTISGENVSGVSYTLEELESWAEDYSAGEGEIYDDNGVIVCERMDGTYHYYYLNDFLTLISNGSLVLVMKEDKGTDEEVFLKGLEEGEYTSSGLFDFTIQDKEGNTIYSDCWNFGQSLREKYSPEDAENLLQVVNANPQLNGKLSIIYDRISTVLNMMYMDIQKYRGGWEYLEEGNTNFTYIYADEDTKKVVTNKAEYGSYEQISKNLEEMTSAPSAKYIIIYPKLKDFETNMDISAVSEWGTVKSYDEGKRWNSIFAISIDTQFPIEDQFYEGNKIYMENIPYLRTALFTSGLAAFLFIFMTGWLTVVAGRNEKDDELHLTGFDRWKTEIAALIVVGVWVLMTAFFMTQWSGIRQISYETNALRYGVDLSFTGGSFSTGMFIEAISLFDMWMLFVYGIFTFCCFFAGYISLVRRIKAKQLWSNSVVRAVAAFGGEVLRARSVTARAGLVVAAFMILQWLAIMSESAEIVLLMMAVDIAVAYIVLSSAIAKGRMKKGIEEISSGNMKYRIPTNGLRGSNKDLAEKLNDIGNGLDRAVEEGMKNERLKTDLITNVSHDIKTPLTSIINYVDILKRSNIEDPKIQGYLDILEAKAQRLKTLTEDVVEASKVSSGNITLECMDVNLSEMIQQTEGEFAEKFAARNLSVVVNLPEEPAVIHVDGRRMWRVLENVFGNAAKYAMPGTRVYADLRLEESTVDFSLKNISEQQLNVSADELTERFIRGDLSRSTEGSGLGLSIAKSLTAMQGGQFELYLDGDLFRVNIRFPRVR